MTPDLPPRLSMNSSNRPGRPSSPEVIAFSGLVEPCCLNASIIRFALSLRAGSLLNSVITNSNKCRDVVIIFSKGARDVLPYHGWRGRLEVCRGRPQGRDPDGEIPRGEA